MPASVSELITWTPVVNGPAAGDPRTASSVRTMGDGLNQRLRWLLGNCVQPLFGNVASQTAGPTAITALNLVSGTITLPNHGFNNNDPVRFFVGANGGSLPADLKTQAVYYAIPVDGDNFKVAATSGGGAIVTMSGTWTGETYAAYVVDALATITFPTVGGVPANNMRGLLSTLVFSSTLSQYVQLTELASQFGLTGGGGALVGMPAYGPNAAGWSTPAGNLNTFATYLTNNIPNLGVANTFGNFLNIFGGPLTVNGFFTAQANAHIVGNLELDGIFTYAGNLNANTLTVVTASVTGNATVAGSVIANQLVANDDFAAPVIICSEYYSNFVFARTDHVGVAGNQALTILDTEIVGRHTYVSWGNGSGGTLTVTLAAHIGADFPQQEFYFVPQSSASILLIVDGTSSATIFNGTGFGTVAMWWNGSNWKVRTYTPSWVGPIIAW